MEPRHTLEQGKEQPTLPYPIKDNRYFRLGWNLNHQDCYTEEDTHLLNRIISLYRNVIGNEKNNHYFTTETKKNWYDYWQCETPQPTTTSTTIDTYDIGESYTLPNRAAKDSKMYPLWNFADSMSRLIANWQSERVKNQNPKLMNDPMMLVFNELRDWFYNELSEKECKITVLDDIAKRQSYLKGLIYLAPNFGPDKYRLNIIQEHLNKGSQLLRDCVANKELPQLLSDLVISGKSLETTFGTYLHFLLINEEVADNFSPNHLDNKESNCQLSPICKIYKANQVDSISNSDDNQLDKYNAHSPFHSLSKISETDTSLQAKISLKTHLLEKVKFASFVNEKDKYNYLEAIATVEALTRVRDVIEKFNTIQTHLGTYVFAMTYLEQANTLANHYIHLIDKAKSTLEGLIYSAEKGHAQLLNRVNTNQEDKFFEKNLRALETRYAKGTTVISQLNSVCQHTISSMNKYHSELNKLASSVQSGEAAREVEAAVRELSRQMNELNSILPGILGESQLTITTKFPEKNNGNFTETSFALVPATCSSDISLNQFEQCDINAINATQIANKPLTKSNESGLDTIANAIPYGLLRGSVNVLSEQYTEPGITREIFRKFTYFTAIFGIKTSQHLYNQYMNNPNTDDVTALYHAIIQAGYETGQLAAVSVGVSMLTGLIDRAAAYCNNNEWTRLGNGLETVGSIAKYGFFARNIITGDLSTPTNAIKTVAIGGASLATGAISEIVAEETLSSLMNNKIKDDYEYENSETEEQDRETDYTPYSSYST